MTIAEVKRLANKAGHTYSDHQLIILAALGEETRELHLRHGTCPKLKLDEQGNIVHTKYNNNKRFNYNDYQLTGGR